MATACTGSDVGVSEVMSGNTRTLAAEDGQYYDYIELANLSGADVDISGWYLSDDAADTMAWRIPDGTVVPAGGYLLFYASGNDAGMHTNFRLSAEGEAAVLTLSLIHISTTRCATISATRARSSAPIRTAEAQTV